MSSDILTYFTLRTIFIFASTAFSLMVVMLALNIITVEEVITMLHLEGAAADAFRLMIARIQEVTGNILEIISQLIGKLLGWSGVDVDLTKIKVDIEPGSAPADPSSYEGTHAPLNHGIDK